MEVTIGKDTIEPKAISIARLIKQFYRLQPAIGCLILSIEDIGDLRFRLIAIAYNGCPVSMCSGFVKEVSI